MDNNIIIWIFISLVFPGKCKFSYNVEAKILGDLKYNNTVEYYFCFVLPLTVLFIIWQSLICTV